MSLYNYAAAFTMFAKGSPLEDIADSMQIPLDTLRAHSSRFGWGGLVKHALAVQDRSNYLPVDTQAAMVRIATNRETNLKQSELLREKLSQALSQYAENTPIPPRILKELANAAATIHDLTYRALGDNPAKKDASQSDRPANTHITVNIPGIISQPRNTKRVIEMDDKEEEN